MRKRLGIIIGLIMFIGAFGASNMENIGIIYEEDFRSVGVSEVDILKAKEIIADSGKKQKLLLLDRKQLELEVNKYLLEDPEKNWEKISMIFDDVGKIEAEMMKNKLKSQIEVKKHISQAEYINARNIAMKRIEETKKNLKK
jgi:hypothetical protein